eukprot:1506691-Prymnesium_polylepis.1
MRAARERTLAGSHLGGVFSPFAGFPPQENGVVAHRTAPPVHLTLRFVTVSFFRHYITFSSSAQSLPGILCEALGRPRLMG